jgi:hypothetical protein
MKARTDRVDVRRSGTARDDELGEGKKMEILWLIGMLVALGALANWIGVDSRERLMSSEEVIAARRFDR